MAAYDFSAPRLFVDAPLGEGAAIPLDRGQANYLLNVLRLRSGDGVLVFNGWDGEWRRCDGRPASAKPGQSGLAASKSAAGT